MTFTKYGDVDVVTTSDFSFTVGVTRAASQTTITKITRGSADNVMVYGRVTTISREFGRVGVTSGSLHLFMKSGKKWIRVGDGFTTSAAGDYTAYNTRAVPRNAIFRVDYIGGPANLPSKPDGTDEEMSFSPGRDGWGRYERLAPGAYTLAYSYRDLSGNVGTATYRVVLPKPKKKR